MIINISRHDLWFICCPVQNMPSSGVLVARVSLTTSRYCSVSFCIAVYNNNNNSYIALYTVKIYKLVALYIKIH